MRLGMPLQAGGQQHPNGEEVPRPYCGMCLPLGWLRSLSPGGFSPESCRVIQLPAANKCAQHVLDVLDMLSMPQATFAKPPVVASRHLCWRSAAGKRPMTYTCRMQLLCGAIIYSSALSVVSPIQVLACEFFEFIVSTQIQNLQGLQHCLSPATAVYLAIDGPHHSKTCPVPVPDMQVHCLLCCYACAWPLAKPAVWGLGSSLPQSQTQLQ